MGISVERKWSRDRILGQRKLFEDHSSVKQASNRCGKALNASAIDCCSQEQRNRGIRTPSLKGFYCVAESRSAFSVGAFGST